MAMQNVCGGSRTPEIQTMYFQNHPANEGTGQNLPANEATCHPLVNVNKPEKISISNQEQMKMKFSYKDN